MSAPYYSDGLVTLHLGDCREVTDWLAADVLVTDPPYGTRFSADNPRGGYGLRQNSGSPDGFVIASDVTTDLRDEALVKWGDRPVLVFGSPRMPDPPGEWADRLVWDKKRLGMNGGPWRYQHESIFISPGFLRTDDASGSILTAWPDQRDHMHVKPLGLMERLVQKAPPGTIADPFAGSGSTLVAARNLGRRAIGVEIDERYCERAARRLSQMTFGEIA
jgi:DNA modification methylase